MEIEFRKSPSYPELMIAKDGRCKYVSDDGTIQPAQIIYKHSYSVNGPVIYYRTQKRTRSLSLRSILFEAWVKGSKISKNDSYEPIDGNHDNLDLDNFMGKKRNKHGGIQITRDPYESPWMNGDAELYL